MSSSWCQPAACWILFALLSISVVLCAQSAELRSGMADACDTTAAEAVTAAPAATTVSEQSPASASETISGMPPASSSAATTTPPPVAFDHAAVAAAATTTAAKAPCVFLNHGGGPMPLMDVPGQQELTGYLTSTLRSVIDEAKPRAIVVVTAHWEAPVGEVRISSAAQPEMYFDYYGFPEEVGGWVARMIGTLLLYSPTDVHSLSRKDDCPRCCGCAASEGDRVQRRLGRALTSCPLHHHHNQNHHRRRRHHHQP
jgi:hypothetical protein